MKNKWAYWFVLIFSWVLYIVSLLLIWLGSNWMVAVGVFCFVWVANAEKSAREM